MSELLAGATIALPSEVTTILDLLRLGSHIIYAFFLAGTVINFVLMIATPLAIKTRWFSLALSILGGISTVLVAVATIIATAISFAAKIALTAQDELNITADVGYKMFGFMWTATVFSLVAFILHAAMGCCCRPVRNKASQEEAVTSEKEKSSGKLSLAGLVRRRKGGAPAATPEAGTTTE